MQTEIAKRSTEIMTVENMRRIFAYYPDVGDFLIHINTADDPLWDERQYIEVCRKFMQGCFDTNEIIEHVQTTTARVFLNSDLENVIDNIVIEYNAYYLIDAYYYGHWLNGQCYSDKEHTIEL